MGQAGSLWKGNQFDTCMGDTPIVHTVGQFGDDSPQADIEHVTSQLQNAQAVIEQIPVFPCNKRSLTIQQQVQLVHYIRSTGKHNVYGPRIPIPSNFNIELMTQLATSVADREVVQFLLFGWPLNHDDSPTTNTFYNHASANAYPQQVAMHIQKELQFQTLLGPFMEPPFINNTAISPMSTREKKDSDQRRIIVDLSWPRNGKAVNDGISDETYLDLPMLLVYPTIDMLCRRACQLGPKAVGYKRDLDRAFKQIGISPNDWPLLGIIWEQLIYYDKTAVMGGRSCPYMCQRLSSFIRHIMVDLSYSLFNYVDDFMGIELRERIWASYNTLGNLLRDLGVKESLKKAVPPTHVLEFLGVLFDLLRMTISVTPYRMQQIMHELHKWETRKHFYIRQLQQLIGKLQFLTSCVRPGRVMLMRLREKLRQSNSGRNEVDEEMMKDIKWWLEWLPEYNGVALMWLELERVPLIATDACLTGIGGTCVGINQYFAMPIPQQYSDYKIHHLEMWAILIALQIWQHEIRSKKFIIRCDNMAVIDVIRNGDSRDAILQQQLRHYVYLIVMFQCEPVLKYINTKDNTLPDLLSRSYQDAQCLKKFKEINKSALQRTFMSPALYHSCIW